LIPKADLDRLRHDVHSTVVECVRGIASTFCVRAQVGCRARTPRPLSSQYILEFQNFMLGVLVKLDHEGATMP
jgi:hypothetical protein